MKFNPETAVLTVDAALVARALPFRAYGDLRYYLNSICIEPEKRGGANVLATDGHTLICLHDPNGVAPGQVLLPVGKGQRTLLNKGGKLHADSDGRAFITDVNGDCVWISPHTKVEGKYPDTKVLLGDIDDYAPGFASGLNPAYLARVREAQKRGGRWAQPVRFFHRPALGDAGAIVATFGSDGFALLMPLRLDQKEGQLRDAVPKSYRVRTSPPEVTSA